LKVATLTARQYLQETILFVQLFQVKNKNFITTRIVNSLNYITRLALSRNNKTNLEQALHRSRYRRHQLLDQPQIQCPQYA
jgi:hypothetical protein